MKIAIYPNHGSSYIPPFITKQLSGKDWIHNRIELANIIGRLEPTHEEITQEIYDLYSSHKPNELNFCDYIKDSKDPNVIFVKDLESQYGYVYRIKVVDVDTSKIWRIGEYDGAEGIEYFNNPEIIDKDLNYGTW